MCLRHSALNLKQVYFLFICEETTGLRITTTLARRNCYIYMIIRTNKKIQYRFHILVQIRKSLFFYLIIPQTNGLNENI